jgi:hypothetical protein
MFQLHCAECVSQVFGPIENNQLKTCSECGQVAFRVLKLNLENISREVALCGAHYTDACIRYPEIRQFICRTVG